MLNKKEGPGPDGIILIALTLCSALLVLPGLGGTCLWQDEAQTGVVARNILRFGVPAADDGTNRVSIFPDHRDVRDNIYIWQPWFPPYLAAASMALFGPSAFGARLPFALCFVGLIAAAYRFFVSWHGNRPRAILTAVLMLACVPLLLHARQCRYYILVPLLNLLVVDAYLKVLYRRSARHAALLVLWVTLLFNSFFPGIPVLVLALAIHFLIRRPGRRALALIAAAAAVFMVINLPVALFCRVWDRQFGVQPGYSGPAVFGMYLLRYLLTLNNHFFPLLLVVLACLLRWKSMASGRMFKSDAALLCMLICTTQLCVFSLLSDFPFTRYLIGMVPFLMFIAAWTLESLSYGRNGFAWLLLLMVAVTNALHVAPLAFMGGGGLEKIPWTPAGIDQRYLEKGNVGLSYARGEVKLLMNTPLDSPLLRYIGSALHPPQGPIDLIVQHLREHAAPNHRVKIAYGDLPLMFHTGLHIVSASEAGAPAPDWLIFRHYYATPLTEDYLQETYRFRYVKEELPVPDVGWNNRPDPLYHYYRDPSPDLAPRVAVFRKQDA